MTSESTPQSPAIESAWLKDLSDRGLIQDVSDQERLSSLPKNTSFYVGFDPTAPSLQLGNLVPLVVAIHLARAGFTPHILFGGATGAIGDPSGKDKERILLDNETIQRNISNQQNQVSALFSKLGLTPQFLNNYDWSHKVSMLDFLRDTGKFLTVNYMLGKEVVKTRLEGNGISFTEFSYMLLQAMDFEYLFRTQGISLQFGGSDQWGNITAGLELIRKKGTGDAVAFSIPLVTNSEGKKFGKSEDGAIWLDAELTSSFKLHQFLLNTSDEDAAKYLKILTFIPLQELTQLIEEHKTNPEKRIAQHRLADELTTIIHGEERTASANRSRGVLFSGSLDGVSEEEILEIFAGVPSSEHVQAEILELPMAEVFALTGLASSRGEAKRLISQGGAYIDGTRIEDAQMIVAESKRLFNSLIVLRLGKKKYHIASFK